MGVPPPPFIHLILRSFFPHVFCILLFSPPLVASTTTCPNVPPAHHHHHPPAHTHKPHRTALHSTERCCLPSPVTRPPLCRHQTILLARLAPSTVSAVPPPDTHTVTLAHLSSPPLYAKVPSAPPPPPHTNSYPRALNPAGLCFAGFFPVVANTHNTCIPLCR